MLDVLDLARQHADQAEVYRVWRRETPVSFEANRLKLLETKESSGLALRLVKGGRIGFSATNDPDDKKGLVERAVELSGFGAEAKFDLPGLTEYPTVRLYDESTERVTIEEMVQTGQGMIDALRATNAEIDCEAGVTKTETEIEIVNSHGARVSYRRSGYAVALHGTLIRGTDMLFVGDWASSTGTDIDPKRITARVVKQLEMARDTVPAPTGKTTVLFSPRGVSSALLSPLTLALNGRTVIQGASPLQDKLGQRLFDERFSLWDDPTIDLRPASRIVDDEGIPARRTTLVDAGAPVTFLYDLQTAGQAGVETTGSASRGLGSLPSPSTSLLVVGEGDTSYDDILAGIDDGLLIEQLLGAGQGNVLGGEFGGNVLLGYRIEKGRITGRVKDTMISGNVYEALKNVVAIASDAEWVGGGLLTPGICCSGVTVSSKT